MQHCRAEEGAVLFCALRAQVLLTNVAWWCSCTAMLHPWHDTPEEGAGCITSLLTGVVAGVLSTETATTGSDGTFLVG